MLTAFLLFLTLLCISSWVGHKLLDASEVHGEYGSETWCGESSHLVVATTHHRLITCKRCLAAITK